MTTPTNAGGSPRPRRLRRRPPAPGPGIPLLAALESLAVEGSPIAPPTLATHIARNRHLAGELASHMVSLASEDSPKEPIAAAREPLSPGLRRALDIIFAAPAAPSAELPARRVAETPATYSMGRLDYAAGLSEDDARIVREAGWGGTEGWGMEGADAMRLGEVIERLAATLRVPRIQVVAALLAERTPRKP